MMEVGTYVWIRHPEVSGAGMVTEYESNPNGVSYVVIGPFGNHYRMEPKFLTQITRAQYQFTNNYLTRISVGGKLVTKDHDKIVEICNDVRDLMHIVKPWSQEEADRDAQYEANQAEYRRRDETAKVMAKLDGAKKIRLSVTMCEVLYEIAKANGSVPNYYQVSTYNALYERNLLKADMHIRDWSKMIPNAKGLAFAKGLVAEATEKMKDNNA